MCMWVCVSVLVCVFANCTVVNTYANLMFLLAGKASSKHQKHNPALKSPDIVEAVMEAEFLPCQDDPSPTNKPLNRNFDDLDIPYIDAEEEEHENATEHDDTKIAV